MTAEPRRIAASRGLRHHPTDAERLLWAKLRNKHVGGFIFRRQHSIGPYVVDFVCLKHKLVIEIDGSQHAAMSMVAADTKGTNFLKMQGYRVLRVWNNEATTNTEGVVEMIRRCLAEDSPSPSVPLPSRERG
ncbi:MAG: endonuclease domain-containing protein [Dehalococcoidia bacterium]|nr:endonuclease domain-containing protein [Dehalococcoidia bacterium]